jgi:hypothetical protein
MPEPSSTESFGASSAGVAPGGGAAHRGWCIDQRKDAHSYGIGLGFTGTVVCQGALPGRRGFHSVLATVHRHGHAERARSERDAVHAQLEPRRSARSRVGRPRRASRAEAKRRRVLARDLHAVVAALALRATLDIGELGPRRGEFAFAFVAQGECEQRPGRWIEALAFGELGARLGELPS